MALKIGEKYLEALKQCDDWVKVSDWAIKVGEIYPDILEKANQQAAGQASETTGVREIAARISSNITAGAYKDYIEIDGSERPRLVRYVKPEEKAAHKTEEIEEDISPLKRSDIVKKAAADFTSEDCYRMSEFEAIAAQLKSCFGLTFEVEHAEALLNSDKPGAHHPTNIQLLLKAHNAKKGNQNWVRFSLEEQLEYIEAAIKLQSIIASRIGIEITEMVLESIKSRIKNVF